jgi:transcriptional regulator with XRE-family HTH domain
MRVSPSNSNGTKDRPTVGERQTSPDTGGTTTSSFVDFLGHAIQVVRLACGFSQERLAEGLGGKLGKTVRQTYISKIEKGRINITFRRLGLICDILQVRPIYVVEMAVRLAEKGNKPDDALLRETLADVASKLADREKPVPSPVDGFLRVIEDELKRRIARTAIQTAHARPKKRISKTRD